MMVLLILSVPRPFFFPLWKFTSHFSTSEKDINTQQLGAHKLFKGAAKCVGNVSVLQTIRSIIFRFLLCARSIWGDAQDPVRLPNLG